MFKEENQRLDELIKHSRLSQAELGRRIGISKEQVNNYVRGRSNIGSGFIERLKKEWPNLNVNWLKDGTGEMFLPENNGNILADPITHYGKTDITVAIEILKNQLDIKDAQIQCSNSQIDNLIRIIDEKCK